MAKRAVFCVIFSVYSTPSAVLPVYVSVFGTGLPPPPPPVEPLLQAVITSASVNANAANKFFLFFIENSFFVTPLFLSV
jgi:hypothetical protein